MRLQCMGSSLMTKIHPQPNPPPSPTLAPCTQLPLGLGVHTLASCFVLHRTDLGKQGPTSRFRTMWAGNSGVLGSFFFLISFYCIIWLRQVLVAAPRIFTVACGIFCCGTRALHCGAQAPEHTGSVVVACGLSCPMVCGILVPRRGILVSRPGIEPSSPALGGRFLTTGPPGKSLESWVLGLWSRS